MEDILHGAIKKAIEFLDSNIFWHVQSKEIVFIYLFSMEKKNLTCNDPCLPVSGGGAPESMWQWCRPGKILKYIYIYIVKSRGYFQASSASQTQPGLQGIHCLSGGRVATCPSSAVFAEPGKSPARFYWTELVSSAGFTVKAVGPPRCSVCSGC